MSIFLISDSHFNHTMLITQGFRPDDYGQQIIANWQRVVGPEDTVLHLGDVIFRSASMLPEIMAKLPGTKILIRGNHDRERHEYYERRGFHLCVDQLVRDEILFTHIPVVPLPEEVSYNIHGHFHNDSSHRSEAFEADPYFREHRDQYLLVEVESTLSPIRLDDFIDGRIPPRRRSQIVSLYDATARRDWELWDVTSDRFLGSYPNESRSLREVRLTVRDSGREYAQNLQLVFHGVEILSGDELINRAYAFVRDQKESSR